MNKFIESIMKVFKDTRHSCTACGSKNTRYRHNLIRGYNHYCQQVYGDWGWICEDCVNVDFKTTIEEHRSTLPEFCEDYGK